MSLINQRPHMVTLTQRPGTPNEKVVESVSALLTSDVNFFDLEPRIHEGDLIESDYFDKPMRVTKVNRHDIRTGGIPPHQQVFVSPIAAETTKPVVSAVTQHFHGSVGAVAGRDVNISVSVILGAIANQIESASIPEAQKHSLMTRLRELAEHPVIAGISTNAIWQMIQQAGS